MKYIFILISIAIFYPIRARAQECGSIFAGPIIQQITKERSYIDSIIWRPSQISYVKRDDPQACNLLVNGTNDCRKLNGITNVSCIHNINKNTTHQIIFADRKIWLWDGKTLKQLLDINMDEMYDVMQSTTDDKGRTYIGVAGRSVIDNYKSFVYKMENYKLTIAINTSEIDLITGMSFSSDYKSIFIADAFKGLIYMYPYDSAKARIGSDKRKVIYDKSEHPEFPGQLSTIAVTMNNEVWISTNDSAAITLYDWKKQKILQTLRISSRNPTSMSYGGENMTILFVGTKKPKHKFDLGGGVIYAIVGTGTQGFQESELPNTIK